ncbi:phosphatase 2C-like domain-containing protein [Ochromonadaceae sp. CCMP2298]|nr:phosphatase 2C-like domain-containing protein [Ochromonadaceae sp. CCMP2298]
MNSRRRNTMEDVHRILPTLGGLAEYSYFGIYDGHGGRQIVDFLEDALEQNIAEELKQPDDASVLERLTRAFLITDMQSKKQNINTSGATAVSVLLRGDAAPSSGGMEGIHGAARRRLYVANVGDSRAVLVSSTYLGQEVPTPNSGFIATRLTFDHRAEDAVEQQRIKVAGGFVARNRVLGILAVSRSFGDHGMKDFVIATPYVTETDLTHCGECPMLIMACDGVWDVFSDQEAADLLLEQYQRAGPFPDAAEILVQAAIDKGSADNVTAIVIFL